MTKTTHPKHEEMRVLRKWHLIDAEGKVLGKVATKVADLIRGKHKAIYNPSVDCGDYVVIINAAKIVVTGQKETQKEYRHHTKFPGGLKSQTVAVVRVKKPERLIEAAVEGMIPRNRLKKHILSKLKVYAGAEHPHGAQSLKTLENV